MKKELIKKIAQKLDSMIKLPGLLELIDGKAIQAVLTLLFNRYFDKIPTQYQDELVLLLEAFASDDYSKVSGATASAINELVDLPWANESDEQQWIACNVQMLSKFILYKRGIKA